MSISTPVVNRHHRVPYDVYIGRGSIWGNPFPIGGGDDREAVIRKYEDYLRDSPELLRRLPEIQGKALACYCAPKPCHGDILAAFADSLAAEGGVPLASISDELFPPRPSRPTLQFG